MDGGQRVPGFGLVPAVADITRQPHGGLRKFEGLPIAAGITVHGRQGAHAAGAIAEACEAWQHALTILDEFDHPDAGDVRARLRRLDEPDGT